MSNPVKTGISAITGKLVTIRHATDADRVRVGEYLAKHGSNDELSDADVVIAAEDQRIIGFGIMRKEREAGCISLFEDSRRKGIGTTIIKHLLSLDPLKRVYATHYASYFSNTDFMRARRRHASRTRSVAPCRMSLMEPLDLTAYQPS